MDSFESVLENKTSELPIAESVDSGTQCIPHSTDAESQSDSQNTLLDHSNIRVSVKMVHMDCQTDFAFLEHEQGKIYYVSFFI